MARKSRGRQKLEMVKMSNQSSLQVTFSKRRSGLFKKASELCTLCGVEVAIIVFSPGNKVYSFGHPCVESILDRFITRTPPQTTGTMQLIEAHRNANLSQLNLHLTQVLEDLTIENKRGEKLNQMRRESQSQRWWEAPVDELNPSQLTELKGNLLQLKQLLTQHVESFMFQHNSALQYFASNTIIDLTDTNNNNLLLPPPPPPPMPPSMGEIIPFDGFNPNNNMEMMMIQPPLIQSAASSQFFVGSSSNDGGMLALESNDSNFNPFLLDMVHTLPLAFRPPPPVAPLIQNEVQQNFQALDYPPPQQALPEFPLGFRSGFY